MQKSFSELEYAAKKKRTRRDRFLAATDAVTPWATPLAEVEPFYPKGDGPGRPPIGLGRMLRMYVAQQCFGLSDEGVEDAIYRSQAIRSFVGIDLNRESAPDATTLLTFCRLLEAHGLTMRIFVAINVHLAQRGKTWYFNSIKTDIGVDVHSGLVHAIVTTPANVADITQARALRHGEEGVVLGDASYQDVERRDENRATVVDWFIAMKCGKRKGLPRHKPGRPIEQLEQAKASLRAKVEHSFHVVKNLFKHRKTRYCGLAKNEAPLLVLFGMANLLMARRRLLEIDAQVVS